jgi:hypothetical protein
MYNNPRNVTYKTNNTYKIYIKNANAIYNLIISYML